MTSRNHKSFDLSGASIKKDGGSSRAVLGWRVRMIGAAQIVLMLLFVSAVWVESDIYRYAGAIMLLVAIIHYIRAPDKVAIGWIGFACITWAAWVAGRYAGLLAVSDGSVKGSAEGIYLFPLLYSTFGYALLLFRQKLRDTVALFVVISLAVAAITFDPAAMTSGARAIFFLHNNPIHASLGMGFVVIAMISVLCAGTGLCAGMESEAALPRVIVVLAALAAILALANVYTLQSKGVWVALAVALPFQIVMLAALHPARARLLPLTALACLVAVASAFRFDAIWAVAGETYAGGFTLVADMVAQGTIVETMQTAIVAGDLPVSIVERLKVWVNALDVWRTNPLLGSGANWLASWQERPFPDSPFNIMHNGYLEIAIRYGLVGLAFYFVIMVASMRWSLLAWRTRLIPFAAVQAHWTAIVFFCMTLLTNSNNRLAIGESFLFVAVGFGFFCYYRLQELPRNLHS